MEYKFTPPRWDTIVNTSRKFVDHSHPIIVLCPFDIFWTTNNINHLFLMKTRILFNTIQI